jgi:hypothetical protein
MVKLSADLNFHNVLCNRIFIPRDIHLQSDSQSASQFGQFLVNQGTGNSVERSPLIMLSLTHSSLSKSRTIFM